MSLTTQWTQIRELSGADQAVAWHAFVDRYRAFVETTLRRLIWSADRAAEASDEFWAYLYQSEVLTHLQAPVRFRAFLSGVLRNYSLDWRRRNTSPEHATGSVDELAAAPALPEAEEHRLWGCQLLHLAMQRLERTQPRWATVLRRFYGLADQPMAPASARVGAWDLATELGLSGSPLNALHQLLFRARRGLRECLTEEVRQTVGTRPELREELALVFASLGASVPGLVEEDPT